jgi:hypothetical protein
LTWFARAVFVLLVGATFAAFFVAQRLKGAPPVVEIRQALRYFSPDGDGRRDVSRFSLVLKEGNEVRVDVVDAGGNTVRRLATAVPVRPDRPLPMRWDGRGDDGRVVPDGPYRVRLGLREEGRSVTVPTVLTVDTRAPHAQVTRILPGQIVGPRAPEMRIYVKGVNPRYATRFRVLRTDGDKPREVAAFRRGPGLNRAIWDGRDGGAPAGPGTYVVEVAVRDRAGNWGTTPASLPPPPGEPEGRGGITVRTIAAQPPLRPVTAGERVEFFVDARRRGYRWTVRRPGAGRPVKRGRVAPGGARPLAFQAPRGRSGLYLLRLQSPAGATSVPFMVQSRERADLLVVLPAITWLGADRVDDPPFDGFPNTLPAGGPVRWPRVFSGGAGGAGDGVPDGLHGQIAPLLAFLDHRGIRYDLTSDLDLALSTGPRASDREGVLLPAPARWVTRPLARRLRRYVLDGGRLATFGVETLRRGVSLRANPDESEGRLVRPTQPTAEDPFGASLLKVRDAGEGATLEPLAGDATYGLLEGTDGLLEGFGTVEESRAPAPGGRRRLIVGLGQPPAEPEPDAPADAPVPEPAYALTATRVGEGLVVRVGLPQWQSRLAEPEIAQVTRNIVDLLRGAKPKIRSAR